MQLYAYHEPLYRARFNALSYEPCNTKSVCLWCSCSALRLEAHCALRAFDYSCDFLIAKTPHQTQALWTILVQTEETNPKRLIKQAIQHSVKNNINRGSKFSASLSLHYETLSTPPTLIEDCCLTSEKGRNWRSTNPARLGKQRQKFQSFARTRASAWVWSSTYFERVWVQNERWKKKNKQVRPKWPFGRPRNDSAIFMHNRADRVLVTNVFATR